MAVIRIILFLIILPVLTGVAVSHKVLRLDRSLRITALSAFPIGYLTIWALMEFLCIPAILLKLPFTAVAVTVLVFACALSAYSLILIFGKKSYRTALEADRTFFKGIKADEWIFILLFVMVLSYVVYKMWTTFFYDEDDSRFVVNAVDVLKDNRILASDPVTGRPLGGNYGDFAKDMIAPWAAFLALGSLAAGLPVAVFAHNIYPVLALLILLCLVWLVICICKEGMIEVSVVFPALTVLLLVLTYGFYTTQSSERFVLSRVWQGKASLAGIGITAIIFAFLLIDHQQDKDRKDFRGFILLFLSNCSACLMSSMGVVLGSVIIASYGIVQGIRKKCIKPVVFAALCCIPNVLLYILRIVYTVQMYVGEV